MRYLKEKLNIWYAAGYTDLGEGLHQSFTFYSLMLGEALPSEFLISTQCLDYQTIFDFKTLLQQRRNTDKLLKCGWFLS